MTFSILKNSISVPSKPMEIPQPDISHDNVKLWKHSILSSQRNLLCRRQSIVSVGVLSISFLTGWSLVPLSVKAEEKNPKLENNEEGEGVLGAIQSLFDPNEKTKSGKLLPKAYLKSAREVVKTLKESLEEDSKDVAKFRRTADAAKESIREYLNDWRGQSSVSAEESYIAIEKAIRSLAGFYSKAGPFATMPDEIKSNILNDLSTAESFL